VKKGMENNTFSKCEKALKSLKKEMENAT